jgi:hypothetical protein
MQFTKPPDPVVAKCGIIQIPLWHSLEASQEYVYNEAGCIETREAEGYVATLPEPYFFLISSGSLYTGQPTYATARPTGPPPATVPGPAEPTLTPPSVTVPPASAPAPTQPSAPR